jgi:glycosyltransferase involved in cell wall biosynthesis
MFPDAPIYTSVFNKNGFGMEVFEDTYIRTSFIQNLPWAKTKHQLYPVLRRFAFRRFDFSDYDLVISSSGAEAKSIIARADSSSHLADGNKPNANYNLPPTTNPVHINYCHSPTHYYWVRPDEYLQSKTMGWLGKLLRFGLRILLKPMRRWDYRAAQSPDIMIANSTLTQKRIKDFYDIDSQVIFPPVDIERFELPQNPPERHGFVSLGRQVHYMRRDVAIEACTNLGLLLRVIGRGPEHEYLRSIAGPTIEFYDDLDDEEVAEALWNAEGLISCGIEDFGITAVEALAAGCPVIALKESGAEDIIKEGKTGTFFNEQNSESLVGTLQNFKSDAFQTPDLINQAQVFSSVTFEKQLRSLIDKIFST